MNTQTKLTLRLDETLIERAKRYAQQHHQSVSQLVAKYFSLLDQNKRIEKTENTPIVQFLRGSLRHARVAKEDYHRHLEKKYL
ncbi:MAG: antitoxin [Gammaproteobacteria bacterium]|nr:antitoxin [Gammaproteobacteria bacterium]